MEYQKNFKINYTLVLKEDNIIELYNLVNDYCKGTKLYISFLNYDEIMFDNIEDFKLFKFNNDNNIMNIRIISFGTGTNVQIAIKGQNFIYTNSSADITLNYQEIESGIVLENKIATFFNQCKSSFTLIAKMNFFYLLAFLFTIPILYSILSLNKELGISQIPIYYSLLIVFAPLLIVLSKDKFKKLKDYLYPAVLFDFGNRQQLARINRTKNIIYYSVAVPTIISIIIALVF